MTFKFKTYFGLADIIARLEQEDPNRILPIGFNNPHSYRGFYAELAFEPAYNISVGEVLEAARSALGATYEGYKGGNYTMTELTDCWISLYGVSGGDKIGSILLELILKVDKV